MGSSAISAARHRAVTVRRSGLGGIKKSRANRLEQLVIQLIIGANVFHFVDGSGLFPRFSLISDALEYWIDAGQRLTLFTDILRKRGNNYLGHLKQGQPPVLVFDHEVIMDGKTLDRPVNYKLARIVPPDGATVDPNLRPAIIIDPRAGHGPGIGGSKRDSQIGMAMKAGYPVYFVLFETDPVPGQTVPDVEKAETRFIEEVVRRHPKAPRPAIIGNCQAGWALAMLSANRSVKTGPLVFNGSPLSYWAGIEGRDTVRYMGGLTGGVWLTSLASDLGNDKFDGANLVFNFELLNLANTLWTKPYNLYANVDTEEQRYLNFERWWNGFFALSAEEMHFITENLFVGNKLEQGRLTLDGKPVDLKQIKAPVVVFASDGDNITPPQQAFNWIVKVWESVDEIKYRQQVVVYMKHTTIGHLGIFVSGKLARKEHKEIIGSFDVIEALPPGLYEMVIEEMEEGSRETATDADYTVQFEERQMEDILALDDGIMDERDFPLVAGMSERNDAVYRSFIRPWVRMCTTELSAEMLRQLHPLRVSIRTFSDTNPFLMPVRTWARFVNENRLPAAQDNFFKSVERINSDGIVSGLNYLAEIRDQADKYWFESIYSNPWLKWFFAEADKRKPSPQEEKELARIKKERDLIDREHWMSRMEEGGFVQGIVRLLVAITRADGSVDRDVFLKARQIGRTHERLKHLESAEALRIVREQTRILQIDKDRAIKAVVKLLPTKRDRADAIEIAREVFADSVLSEETKTLIQKIQDADKDDSGIE